MPVAEVVGRVVRNASHHNADVERFGRVGQLGQALVGLDQPDLAELPARDGVQGAGLGRGVVTDADDLLAGFLKAGKLADHPLVQKVPVAHDLLNRLANIQIRERHSPPRV